MHSKILPYSSWADGRVRTFQSVATGVTTMKFPNPVPSWLVLKFGLCMKLCQNKYTAIHSYKAEAVTGLPHGIAWDKRDKRQCVRAVGQPILQALRQSDTCRPLLPVPPVPRNTRGSKLKRYARRAPKHPMPSHHRPWHPMALHAPRWNF